MPFIRLFVASLLTAVAAVALAEAPAETLPFEVASVAYHPVVEEQEFDAVIEAVNKSTVSAQISGRVVEVNFDVDDYVPKGAVLLRLRGTEQRAALKAAEARHAEAQAEFERAKELLARQLLSRSDYDRVEAALKGAAAAVEQAREQSEHSVVRAPYSGIVVERHIEPGETASPGRPLMTGISLEALRATASVPQSHIAAVRALSRARVILFGDRSVEGATLTISPYADPASHTFKVRVDLPGVEGLYPGMFAKVAFATGEGRRLLVPARSIAYRSEVTALYVVRPDGAIAFRQVRLGDRFGDEVEVLAGLSEGERIALDPIKAGIFLKEKRAGSSS